MENKKITEKLLEIQNQVTQLGHEFISSKRKIRLDDVQEMLKPFIEINSAIDKSIKKFSSDIIPGSIPKQNALKS